MHSQNRNNRRFGLFFLFIVLAIPSVLAYYVSTPYHQEYFKEFVQERARRFGHNMMGDQGTKYEYAPDLPIVSKERVLLAKDNKIIIDRTCIVFKNLKKDMVEIDLYLLELDPDVPYSLTFLKKDMNKGIRLGNNRFRLISVNEKKLKLKRLESYHTR
ncbi:hypothetical protein [Desulfospira joergensenii]|uniref:hypothetical protein n=1 Tax=Desulfospira joergensenii TaxID=53329 RepID=UPI0003B3488C|nr:hypothetical protein [Desulfospira joergensenii]